MRPQLLGALLLLTESGCDSPAPTPMPVARVDERPASPAPKPPPPPPPPPSPLEGADPNDIFDEAESLPNFEIVGPAPEADPRDLFAAVTPAGGADSSNFEVTQPGASNSSGTLSNAGKLPSGFRPVAGTRGSADGWPLRIVCERDSSEMAFVPAGAIQLGHDQGPAEVTPAVKIDVSAFYIDVTEVTLDRFAKFRGDAGPKIPAPLNDGQDGQRPALGVMWLDAREYAKWAGKDLPTEAEWELAARGVNSLRTPWGDGRAIFERPRAPGQIEVVAAFAHDKSPFGLFDVAGNAREWCADHYSPKAFSEAMTIPPNKRKDWTGPRQPSRPNLRVVKGGSPDWSLWHRTGLGMRERAEDVGFRCVLRLRS